MAKVIFLEDQCKGCGLCILACPKKIVSISEKLNKKGFSPAQVLEQDKCIGCAFCAISCPDVAIRVEK